MSLAIKRLREQEARRTALLRAAAWRMGKQVRATVRSARPVGRNGELTLYELPRGSMLALSAAVDEFAAHAGHGGVE